MQSKRVERRSAASWVRLTSHPARPASPSIDPAAARRRARSAPVAVPVPGHGAELHALESRTLFTVSLAFEALGNASHYPANQSETAIAMNRLNPNQLFMGSNHGAFTEPDQGPNDPIAETGIFASYSLDGGATWVPRVMAKDDVAPFNVSDDNDTTPAARLIGDVNITDSAGGSTNDVALGDLVTDASGVTYAINFGPGNRIQISSLSFPTTPVGAQGQVTGTTVAEVYGQTLAAGGSVLGGSISAVTAAAFNPVDGRLYYVVSGFAPPKFGADLLFSMDLSPALSRAQREASVTLVGDFGPLTNGAPTVTGIAFDQVPTGVDLVGLYVDTTTPAPPQPAPGPGQPPVPGQAVNTQMFRVKLTDVRIRNPFQVVGTRDNIIPAGVFGGISIHRDTPDAQNDVIAVVSDDLTTEGVTDAAVVRIAADGTAVLLGPLADATGVSPTGVNPTGVAFNPTLTDPFTNTPGAYVGVDGASDELFFVDVRDRVLPVACCDPSAAYDDFGNLYYAYIAINQNQQTSTTVLVSTDNGQSFWQIADFQGVDQSASVGIDRCEITTARQADGTVTVWVSFDDFGLGSEMAAGMKVGGLGGPFGTTDIGTNGSFTTVESVPFSGQGNGNTSAANIAHLAIGPDGQVVYTWQTVSFLPSDKIYTNTDPDGLGPQPMGNAVFVDNTHVGFKEPLPSQPLRGISAVPSVSFDRSNGPHRGRVYMAYTHEVATDVIDPDTGLLLGQNSDSDILLRWSDDNGASWSGAVRVNDDPLNSNAAQFFQRVVVDQVTGNVGVGWLDTRDSQSNDQSADVGYYATVGQPTGTGIVFAPNMRLNVGPSNARFSGNFGNDFGDYTALDFYDNVLWAAYPDNSNSTGDNPSGKLRAYDIYAARVRVTDTTEPIIPFVTPSSPLAPTVVKPQSLVKKGKYYQLKVTYSHPSGINLATVGNDDVVVTGPNGFSQPMQLLKAKAQKKTHSVQATYRLPAPGGSWDASENAVYTATLQAGAVTSTDGSTTTEAGTLTNFLVNVKPKKGKSKTSKQAPPPPAVMAAAALASPFSDAAILSGDKGDDALALLA